MKPTPVAAPYRSAEASPLRWLAFALLALCVLLPNPGPAAAQDALWQQVFTSLPFDRVLALAVHPSGTLIAGSVVTESLRSEDHGLSWTAVSLDTMRNNVFSLGVSPDGTLYAGSNPNGLYRSTDVGLTWTRVGLSTYTIDDFAFSREGNILFAQGPYVSLSQDNMTSSSLVLEGPSFIFGWTFATGAEGEILAGGAGCLESTCGSLYRSTDEGLSWTQLTGHNEHIPIYSLVADDSSLIVAGSRSRVWYSRNAGITWELSNGPGSTGLVNNLVLDHEGRVYAALDEGVSRSSDGGKTWERYGLEGFYVNALAIDNEGHLLAGTRSGIHRSILPVQVATEAVLPEARSFELGPVYPNPFREEVTISFILGQPGPVVLKVYDVLGRAVGVLVSGFLPAGMHEARWEAGDLPGGVYVCRLEAGALVLTRSLILVR